MRLGRYIVYGAGGIGASLGAQLHRVGREVVLIARGAQLAALREMGLEYVTPEGRERLALPVVGHPGEVDFRAGDAVILAMKTQHSLAAIEALAAFGRVKMPFGLRVAAPRALVIEPSARPGCGFGLPRP